MRLPVHDENDYADAFEIASRAKSKTLFARFLLEMLSAILAIFISRTLQDTAVGHAVTVAFRHWELVLFSIASRDAIAKCTCGTTD